MSDSKPSLSTTAVHAGEDRDGPYRSLIQPLVQSSTFIFKDTDELMALKNGETQRHEYGRYGNPTQDAVEAKLAALEGGEAALVFPSGMAAITTTMLCELQAGDHFVFTKQTYRRTLQFCEEVLPKLGIEGTMVQTVKTAEIRDALRPETKMVFIETPTNPYLYIADIPALAELCQASGAQLVLDATFGSPLNLRGFELGADVVIHSATKYLGGHNDVISGVTIGSADLVGRVRKLQGLMGCILDAHAAFLLARGIKTFPLRMAYQNQSALAIATALEAHPNVTRVFYPGLESHPDHSLAKRDLRGFGGVVSFEIDGDFDATCRFIDHCKWPQNAPSFGGVESLIEQPALMSYYEYGERERYGITDNLVRLSVGIEATDDLIADLLRALDRYK